MQLPDIASASASAAVLGRLVQAPTSRVVVQLLEGELPTGHGIARDRMRGLVEILSRPGYLLGIDDDVCEATAALGAAAGLEAEVTRRLLQRGLAVTTMTHRAFVRSGSSTAVVEEVGRASSPEKHELDVAVPWNPWQVLDAVADVLDIDLPPWRVAPDDDTAARLWQLESDASVIAGATGSYYSDEAHATVVQLGDLVGRLAAVVADVAELQRTARGGGTTASPDGAPVAPPSRSSAAGPDTALFDRHAGGARSPATDEADPLFPAGSTAEQEGEALFPVPDEGDAAAAGDPGTP